MALLFPRIFLRGEEDYDKKMTCNNGNKLLLLLSSAWFCFIFFKNKRLYFLKIGNYGVTLNIISVS